MIGLLGNGLFADSAIIALDGVNTSAVGGWLNGNWKQLYIQFAYVCACTAYSFVVTALIARGIDCIPGLHLRATPEEEGMGMDDAEVRLIRLYLGYEGRDVLTRDADWRVCERLHRSPPRLSGLDTNVQRQDGQRLPFTDRRGRPPRCARRRGHARPSAER